MEVISIKALNTVDHLDHDIIQMKGLYLKDTDLQILPDEKVLEGVGLAEPSLWCLIWSARTVSKAMPLKGRPKLNK